MADGSQDRAGESPDDVDVERLVAENQALKESLDRRTFWRRVLTWLLVVLTSIGVVSSTVAIWAHETVFDTDQFMETLEPALSDPALYAVIGDRTATSVLEALDLQARVTDSLTRLDEFIAVALLEAIDLDDRGRELLSRFDRPTLDALAPPIVEALESRVRDRVETFFASEAFVSRFPALVRRSHEVTVALVRNELQELPNVYVADGEVRLNLIPFIAEALRTVIDDIRGFLPDVELPAAISDRLAEGREQLGEASQAELPEDFGQLTFMSEDALVEVQTAAERLDRFVWVVVLVTILMGVLTIAVSPSRRRTAVHLALGSVVGFVLAAMVVRRLEGAILEHVTSPDGSEAARVLMGRVFSSLRTTELVVALGALAIGVIAYLAGRPAWVTRTVANARSPETADWIASHYDLLRLAGVAVALVALFVTGMQLWSVLVVALVLGGYLWLLWEAKKRSQPVVIG